MGQRSSLPTCVPGIVGSTLIGPERGAGRRRQQGVDTVLGLDVVPPNNCHRPLLFQAGALRRRGLRDLKAHSCDAVEVPSTERDIP